MSLAAVADDLRHLAEVVAVATTTVHPSRSATTRRVGSLKPLSPPRTRPGPCVSTLWVSESARRIETRPVIPSASAPREAPASHRRRRPIAEAAGDSKAEHRSAGDPSGIDRREQERAALEIVARGELELAVEIAPVGGKARDGDVPARQERRRLAPRSRSGRTRRARAGEAFPRLPRAPAWRAAERLLRGRRLRPRPHRGGPENRTSPGLRPGLAGPRRAAARSSAVSVADAEREPRLLPVGRQHALDPPPVLDKSHAGVSIMKR